MAGGKNGRSDSLCESRTCPRKAVLELGCGTGLSGIVAAKCGAHVLFTDKRDPPEILDNCKENCRLNGLTDYEVVMYPVSMGCRFQCSGESRFRTFPPST